MKRLPDSTSSDCRWNRTPASSYCAIDSSRSAPAASKFFWRCVTATSAVVLSGLRDQHVRFGRRELGFGSHPRRAELVLEELGDDEVLLRPATLRSRSSRRYDPACPHSAPHDERRRCSRSPPCRRSQRPRRARARRPRTPRPAERSAPARALSADPGTRTRAQRSPRRSRDDRSTDCCHDVANRHRRLRFFLGPRSILSDWTSTVGPARHCRTLDVS